MEVVGVFKVSSLNKYRYFTLEENELFNNIILSYYGKDPKKIKQLALLEKAFKNDEITKEEFFSKKDELDLDFFGQCIKRFKDQTIARVQYHELNEIENAF